MTNPFNTVTIDVEAGRERAADLACYTTGDDKLLPMRQFLQLVVDRIQDDLRDGTYESGPNSNNPGDAKGKLS